MTFSICTREEYMDGQEVLQTKFGAAITTRRPCVGSRCLWGNQHGIIATQGKTNPHLGQKGSQYLSDGIGVKDAITALLNTDDGSEHRQIHGVDSTSHYTHSGAECREWYGHQTGEGYTVAGNFLVDKSVVNRVTEEWEQADCERLFVDRLVDALSAGYEAGGDRREHREIQSAAVLVHTTEPYRLRPFEYDVRVDASKTPLADIKQAVELSRNE